MGISMQIQGGIILTWLLILSAGVSSYRSECWSFLCVTDSNLNCTCRPEMPNWLIPTICLIPLLIIGTCCIKMCIFYYKERNRICLPDGTYLVTPSPLPMPDVISTPNFELRIPPSYNEAVGKEPCPLEDPPAYEHIAMECVSSPDVSISAVLLMNDDTPTV